MQPPAGVTYMSRSFIKPSPCVWLLAAVLTVACGTGVLNDNNSSSGEQPAARLRLEEVATIGGADRPQIERVSVYAMGLDPDGLIWSVDRYPPHMRVFRTNGELVTTFGPSGEGPGDFRRGPMEHMVTGHAVLAGGGGRVLVHQMYPGALVGFDLEGNEISDRPIEAPDPFAHAVMVLVRAPAVPRAFMLARAVDAAHDGESFVVHRLDFGGDSVESVEIASGVELFPNESSEAGGRQWFSMAVAPDGTLVVGDSYTYRIKRLDADGNVLSSFGRTVARPLLSENVLQSIRQAARRKGESEDDVDIHDVHFRRNAFEFDDLGRLWVVLNRPTRERSMFDLFAPDGTYLQQLEVPYHVQRYNFRGADPAFLIVAGYLVATVVGPDGNDQIKVWRVIDD